MNRITKAAIKRGGFREGRLYTSGKKARLEVAHALVGTSFRDLRRMERASGTRRTSGDWRTMRTTPFPTF